MVLPTPIGVLVRRPGDGQRMHAVLVFEDVRLVEAVLAPGAGNQAVIAAVVLAMLVAQRPEFFFAGLPIDFLVFAFGGVAGIADHVLIELDCGLPGRCGVLIFDRRIRALIGNDALGAELHLTGQSILHFELFGGFGHGVKNQRGKRRACRGQTGRSSPGEIGIR
jgi:hypothetical protein